MAGAKLKDGDILYVSDAVVTAEPADAAAYEVILGNSTQVNNIVTAPDMGYTVSTANHDYLDSTFSLPQKGIAVGSSSDIVYGRDPSGDAGQAILKAAALPTEKGYYVITIKRLDGSATSIWGPISSDAGNGGGNGTFNEVSCTITVAAVPVDYTPTP